jgi:hypothetical protein
MAVFPSGWRKPNRALREKIMVTLSHFQNAKLHSLTYDTVSAAANVALSQIEAQSGAFPHSIIDEYGNVLWSSVHPTNRRFPACVVELQILAVSVFEVAA